MNGLDAFLHTDPRDAGCDRTMHLLDIYGELVVGGRDAASRYPDIAIHLRACAPCAEDLATLVEAISDRPC